MAIYTDYWVSSDGAPRIPAFGTRGRGLNVAECIIASGSTAGVPTATSDSDAHIMLDTQETFEIFNVEGGSDSEGPSKGVWVVSVHPVSITNSPASVTLSIGDADDANGWADDTAIACSASDQGLLAIVQDTADYPYNEAGGRYYPTSSGEILIALAGADFATGRLAVYATYFRCERSGGGF